MWTGRLTYANRLTYVNQNPLIIGSAEASAIYTFHPPLRKQKDLVVHSKLAGENNVDASFGSITEEMNV